MNAIDLRQMHQEDPQQYASLDDLVSNDGCMDFEDDGNTEWEGDNVYVEFKDYNCSSLTYAYSRRFAM